MFIRELRELTRHRQTLVRDLSAVANRIQKHLESAIIKLSQVATNTLGLSGRLMLKASTDGETDAGKMAQLAKGRLKAKTAQLEQALTGSLTPTQRFLLKELLDQYDHIQGAIDRINVEIQRQLQNGLNPFLPEAVKLLQTIPGVGERVAETIVSEICLRDVSRF